LTYLAERIIIKIVNVTVAFVLGADDPEMREIERILGELQLPYGYAAVQGRRCHPGNSYDADGVLSHEGRSIEVNSDNAIVVECSIQGVTPIRVIDHHRPNDPGYGMLPADFWQASSIGQLIEFLRMAGYSIGVSQDMRVLAAMDHCRQAAIRGECPGVTAEEVIARRVDEIAAASNLSSMTVRQLLDKTCAVLGTLPVFEFGGGYVIDYTGQWLGVGWSVELLVTQTSLDVIGAAALLHHADQEGSDEKITISGHVTPEMVGYFTDVYAAQLGLKRVYGVPARGYAGGYL
jgi:hypothetical protein